MEPLAVGDPRRVGEYRLLGRLGAGGMGEVFLGRSPGGRTVAVKLVRGEYAADPEFRARFRQEVAAARSAAPSVSASPSSSPSPSPSPSPSVAAGVLPAAFVGTWQGNVRPVNGTHGVGVYRVEFGPGRISELVGRSTTSFASVDRTCESAEVLLAVTADTVVIGESAAGGDCSEVGITQAVTFRLNSDGTLGVTQDGWVASSLVRQ